MGASGDWGAGEWPDSCSYHSGEWGKGLAHSGLRAPPGAADVGAKAGRGSPLVMGSLAKAGSQTHGVKGGLKVGHKALGPCQGTVQQGEHQESPLVARGVLCSLAGP